MSVTQVLFRKTRSALFRFKQFVHSARFGFSPDQIYDASFYDSSGFAKTPYTAEKIASYLFERYQPTSVMDFGCGTGNYLIQFAQKGCQVLGVEGSQAGIQRVPESVTAIHFDLREPLLTNKRFDLVMSIEVAEHIPHKYSSVLVASICRHAKELIVFTAAPPNAPGEDHINSKNALIGIASLKNMASFTPHTKANLSNNTPKHTILRTGSKDGLLSTPPQVMPHPPKAANSPNTVALFARYHGRF